MALLGQLLVQVCTNNTHTHTHTAQAPLYPPDKRFLCRGVRATDVKMRIWWRPLAASVPSIATQQVYLSTPWLAHVYMDTVKGNKDDFGIWKSRCWCHLWWYRLSLLNISAVYFPGMASYTACISSTVMSVMSSGLGISTGNLLLRCRPK